MTTPYKVTPEYVSNAAASCTNTAAEIQTQLSVLKTYVVNLEAVWHGIASAPIFAWELSLGVWMAVKGFRPSAITTSLVPTA